MRPEITPDVGQKLGFYVYVDPRDGDVFYIGKGVGDRATAHLDAGGESRKVQRIRDIRAAGFEPRIDIVSAAGRAADFSIARRPFVSPVREGGEAASRSPERARPPSFARYAHGGGGT